MAPVLFKSHLPAGLRTVGQDLAQRIAEEHGYPVSDLSIIVAILCPKCSGAYRLQSRQLAGGLKAVATCIVAQAGHASTYGRDKTEMLIHQLNADECPTDSFAWLAAIDDNAPDPGLP
jgi:hypothetical protein